MVPRKLWRVAAAPRSIRWHLGALCLLLILPATVFFGLLLWQYAASERNRLVQEGLALARNLSEAVEQDLASLVGTARLAASAPRLQAGDIDTSGVGARGIGRALGVDFVIRDPSGRQLMNTGLDPSPAGGRDMPNRTLPVDDVIRETREPAVSDLFRTAADGRLAVAVVAPVLRPGTREILYFIDLVTPPERLRDIMLKQPLPQGIVVTLVDSRGRVIARSRAHERFVGVEARDFMAAVRGPAGHYEGRSLDGVPLLVYYVRLTGSNWMIAVGVEQQTLDAPIWRLVAQLLAMGAVLAFLSAILAYLFGRRISAALERLSVSAAALGRGGLAFPIRSPITEVNEVSETLIEASGERKRHEQSQALMVRELHHRVKNTLATVQAVVSASARNARSIDELRDTVTERIVSLARTHTLLVNNDWGGAPLRAILEAELTPYDDPERPRVRLEGEDVHVPDDIALAVGMTAHEFTTNAAKYGALSAPGGILLVRWRVEGGAERRSLVLDWQESGGPPVAAPSRRGFGSQLIERVVTRQLQGEVQIDFAPDGLKARLSFPLSGSKAPEPAPPG
ncbi:MAG TPA: sensor histidine kinase [Microvirga sp.]|jgi:two-component sensor histidine kinase|nr:sensor histidine kinase [Microvirga sp.]